MTPIKLKRRKVIISIVVIIFILLTLRGIYSGIQNRNPVGGIVDEKIGTTSVDKLEQTGEIQGAVDNNTEHPIPTPSSSTSQDMGAVRE